MVMHILHHQFPKPTVYWVPITAPATYSGFSSLAGPLTHLRIKCLKPENPYSIHTKNQSKTLLKRLQLQQSHAPDHNP